VLGLSGNGFNRRCRPLWGLRSLGCDLLGAAGGSPVPSTVVPSREMEYPLLVGDPAARLVTRTQEFTFHAK